MFTDRRFVHFGQEQVTTKNRDSGESQRVDNMQVGTVVGTATSTVKHASMEGWKLLIVQPMRADGTTADGDPVLAIDQMGAGAGQEVILTSDGQTTREMLGVDATPVRWSVMGIKD
jgi:microcompartment protein CcmK/EutM